MSEQLSQTLPISEELQQALSFANLRSSIVLAKRMALTRFEVATTINYNGGIFKLTPTTLSYLTALSNRYPDSFICLDDMQLPIVVDNPTEFMDTVWDTYNAACFEYQDTLQQLKRSRQPNKVIGISE